MVVRDVVLDFRDSFRNMTKDHALQPPGGEVTEPPFDEMQPGTARGDTVQVKPRVPLHSSAYGRMRVGRIVVHDEMQRAIRGRFPVQPLQELNPFLMRMPWLTGLSTSLCDKTMPLDI